MAKKFYSSRLRSLFRLHRHALTAPVGGQPCRSSHPGGGFTGEPITMWLFSSLGSRGTEGADERICKKYDGKDAPGVWRGHTDPLVGGIPLLFS